jgi:4-amino-4-deoxy-L-arabinose transferase-like glycosyltransferase
VSGGWFRLMVWVLGMVLVWSVFLPWVGRWWVVREHLELMERSNINAGAMFYTEVENER